MPYPPRTLARPSPEKKAVPMIPNVPGGLAVSLVGILNGAINAIVPQVYAVLAALGIGPPV